MSADGRYVAFQSDASNLVPGDTNHSTDVFVRDLRSGTTRRVSVATDGTQANGDSFSPAISADGRYVAFVSDASNLVPGDTNHSTDVFVRDLRLGTTQRVSVAADGSQGRLRRWPGVDQRRRALRDLRRRARQPGARRHDRQRRGVRARSAVGHHAAGQRGHRRPPGQQRSPSRGDQRRWAIRGLRHGRVEWCPATRTAATTCSCAICGWAPPGGSAWPPTAPRATATATRRRSAPTDATWPSSRTASNLVPGGTNEYDVFVRDLRSGTTRRVSVATNGSQGNEFSGEPAISADGRYVTFDSNASNLVPGDTKRQSRNVFVRDLRSGTTRLVSVATNGTQANGGATPRRRSAPTGAT